MGTGGHVRPPVEESSAERRADGLACFCGRNLVPVRAACGTVFIVGMPRSGTTLIQGILCNTGEYFPMPETHFFVRAAYGLPEKNLNLKDRKRIQHKLLKKSRIKLKRALPDYLTTQIYPAIHGLVRNGQMLLEQKLSGPQTAVLKTLISPLQQITTPPELVDDVNQLLSRL